MQPRLEHQSHVAALDLEPRAQHVHQKAAPVAPRRQVLAHHALVVRKRQVGRARLDVDVVGIDLVSATLVRRIANAHLRRLLERLAQPRVADVLPARRDGA